MSGRRNVFFIQMTGYGSTYRQNIDWNLSIPNCNKMYASEEWKQMSSPL